MGVFFSFHREHWQKEFYEIHSALLLISLLKALRFFKMSERGDRSFFVYQFNNNIVTRIFLFPDHLKENSKKDRYRWQKNRPQANTSQQIIDPNSNTLYDQNALASLMKVPPKSLPKWLNDIILGELRPLFLRVRFLDEKNEILDLIN